MEMFQIQGHSLIFQHGYEMLQLEPWGKNSVRVRAIRHRAIRNDAPHALLDQPTPEGVTIAVDGYTASLTNGLIRAEIQVSHDWDGNATGYLTFWNTQTGAEILTEHPPHHQRVPARWYKTLGGDLFHLEMTFRAYEGERLYGLGQHQHGRLDQKGCVIDLWQINSEVSIPFLVSNRGYGFLWNNPAVGRVELGHTHTRWVAEACPQLDYWVTIGETPAQIMHQYADITGYAPMLPEWASGFWQSKMRYRNQAEVMAVVAEHKRRQLPLSVIVIDFFHATVQGNWDFDPEFWQDPRQMVADLAEQGVKVMVSIWHTVNSLSRTFAPMQAKGYLVGTERGIPFHTIFFDTKPEGAAYLGIYDPTNPEARRFFWEQLRQGYYQHGVKLFWLDAAEPEIQLPHWDNLRYALGNGAAVTHLYPLYHAQMIYDGLQAEGETEIVTLCRSAWAGSQRYGTLVWSGDVNSTFEALQIQVRAGLNIALSGIPWWTTDIGGFHGGDPDSPYFRELIVRWFQYGAFCPIFRLHGCRQPVTTPTSAYTVTGADNEVWSFGEEAYEILRFYLLLRERLQPYIQAQMYLAHTQGLPPMRPLWFDYPEDAVAYLVEDAFLLGADLLVAPILHQGLTSRQVYLPEGTDWIEVWSKETHQGGQWLQTEADLSQIPLYVRAGSQLAETLHQWSEL